MRFPHVCVSVLKLVVAVLLREFCFVDYRYKSLRRYIYSMSSKKKHKSPCSFASSKKPSKSKVFEIIRYIVRAGRKLTKTKTKAKTNLQTRTHKSHGRTIVAGNCLQENLVKSISCRFCHADVTLLENVSASSGLGSSWIVSCENKHCPSRNSSVNLLTNLVARAAEFRSCKGYFPPKEATFEPAL